jgi:hypothetical protein
MQIMLAVVAVEPVGHCLRVTTRGRADCDRHLTKIVTGPTHSQSARMSGAPG